VFISPSWGTAFTVLRTLTHELVPCPTTAPATTAAPSPPEPKPSAWSAASSPPPRHEHR
jgi:hypothetical protein